MYRKDALNRYQLFLNEWLEYIQADLPVTTRELCTKYGVSQNFPAFLSKRGFFKREGGAKHGKWTTTQKLPFTKAAVQNLIDAFNAYKYTKKNPVIKDRVLVPTNGKAELILAPRKNGSLSETATQDLINELKRRGYKGHITSEINF